MSHTELGWIVLGVIAIGALMQAVPVQPPAEIEILPPPEPIGSVSVESIEKPSEAPASVAVGESGHCSDGSCTIQRRGIFSVWRRR